MSTIVCPGTNYYYIVQGVCIKQIAVPKRSVTPGIHVLSKDRKVIAKMVETETSTREYNGTTKT